MREVLAHRVVLEYHSLSVLLYAHDDGGVGSWQDRRLSVSGPWGWLGEKTQKDPWNIFSRSPQSGPRCFVIIAAHLPTSLSIDMMDEEYQALIESGFPSTNDSAPDLVDESSAQALREEIFGRNAQQEADIDPSLEAGDGGEGDAGDSGELGDESERKGKRRKNASGHMTDEEKKSKQRDQNRRAAEKSRSKKRNE